MRDKKGEVLVMGCHCLEEILNENPQRIIEVLSLAPSNKTESRKIKILARLEALKIPLKIVRRSQLDHLLDSTNHQGFAAYLKKNEPVEIKSFLKKAQNPSFVVALDSVYDPHNLGAILRAAECFKVDLVFWSKNRGVSLTPTAAKASASASLWVPCSLVSNLATTLAQFKENGYTLLVAQLGEKSENLFHFKFPEKSLLILGSEKEGVRPILRKLADVFLEIPMFGKIDSLSVSQAATLFFGFWKKGIQ